MLSALVHYFHTNEVEDFDSPPLPPPLVANKYDINSLLNMCSDNLYQNISIVGDTLVVADTPQDDELSNYCADLSCSHSLYYEFPDELVNAPSQRQHLLKERLHAFSKPRAINVTESN